MSTYFPVFAFHPWPQIKIRPRTKASLFVLPSVIWGCAAKRGAFHTALVCCVFRVCASRNGPLSQVYEAKVGPLCLNRR